MQYRRDHSFFDRYSQCDVDVGVMTNAFAGPTRVHSRMLGQYTGDQRDQQIGERGFDAVCPFHFDG